MAKAEQIIELLKSHLDRDDKRFYAIAMQVAAHEACLGHEKLAKELKALIDQAKERHSVLQSQATVISLAQPKGELAQLLTASYPEVSLSKLTFSDDISTHLKRIITEQKQQATLRSHGLAPRRKLLLYGATGTGKTISASALATELRLPLFTIRLDGVLTKYLGETATKLRVIFEAMASARGVYFFDEFDAIGSDRALGNDVGEIRRVLNSFLLFMEQDISDSLIITATNHVRLLDNALFRRFDDVIEYQLPDAKQIKQVICNRLHAFKMNFSEVAWQTLCAEANGLSHAEITRACDEAAKDTVLYGASAIITEVSLLAAFSARKVATRHSNP